MSLCVLCLLCAVFAAKQQSSLRTDQTRSPRSTQSKLLAFAVSAISALNESLRPLPALRRLCRQAAELAEDDSNDRCRDDDKPQWTNRRPGKREHPATERGRRAYGALHPGGRGHDSVRRHVNDPATWTRPWTASFPLHGIPGTRCSSTPVTRETTDRHPLRVSSRRTCKGKVSAKPSGERDQSILIFRRNCWFSLQTNSIGSSSTVTR
jgi:hypothetical protein